MSEKPKSPPDRHRKLRESGRRFVEQHGRDVDRWIGSTQEERGRAGVELMQLADKVLKSRGGVQGMGIPDRLEFPRISSRESSVLVQKTGRDDGQKTDPAQEGREKAGPGR